MSLDDRPARPLTSREIAKLFSGTAGGLAEFCEPEQIRDAFRHFAEHESAYFKTWLKIHDHCRGKRGEKG